MRRASRLIAVTAIVTAALNISCAQAQNSPTAPEELGAPLLRLGAGVGVLGVVPDVDSPVLGAKISPSVLPTLSVYIFPGEGLVDLVPWTKYLRVSTELGVTTHDVRLGGTQVGHVSTVPLNGNFEFHPFSDSRLDPFVGAGFNVIIFTDQTDTVGGLRFDRQPAGALFLVGVDYWLTRNLFAEARVRKLLASTGVVSRSTGQKIEQLDLDPWTFGFSVGFRF